MRNIKFATTPTAAPEYRRYAESVLAYEDAAKMPTCRQSALFATEHEFDKATELFAGKVARPLADPASPHGPIGKNAKFALRTFVGDGAAADGPASRASLVKILRGDAGLHGLIRFFFAC